jgi:hypothetical protein
MPPQNDPHRTLANTPPGKADLGPGARVEVRNRFDGSWSAGFEVAEALPPLGAEAGTPAGDGVAYRVRRLGDGSVLDATFRPEEVRRPAPSRWPRFG